MNIRALIEHRNLWIAQRLWKLSDWIERLGDKFYDRMVTPKSV